MKIRYNEMIRKIKEPKIVDKIMEYSNRKNIQIDYYEQLIDCNIDNNKKNKNKRNSYEIIFKLLKRRKKLTFGILYNFYTNRYKCQTELLFKNRNLFLLNDRRIHINWKKVTTYMIKEKRMTKKFYKKHEKFLKIHQKRIFNYLNKSYNKLSPIYLSKT